MRLLTVPGLLLLLGAVALLPAWAEAGTRSKDVASAGRPAMRIFTDRDGLPQNSIEGLLVDRKGYLWVGTQDGAAFYNGRTWSPVSLPDLHTSRWVRSMIQTSDGSLWFGRDMGGVCRLKDGQWESYDTAQGLPHTRVLSLLERRDGTLLAGTATGLARFHEGRWQPVTEQSGLLASGVLGLHEGPDPGGPSVLWVATEKGLGRLQDGQWRWFTKADGLPHSTVWSVLDSVDEAGQGVVWAGTSQGLARWDGKAWKNLARDEGLPRTVVNRILETRDAKGQRSLWLATEQGLVIREKGSWTLVDSRQGFPNNVIRSLHVATSPDGVRTVWAGTFGGLVRMVSGTWLSFSTQNGLPDNVSFALGETRHPEAFWVGFLGGGLARFENGQWHTYGEDSEVPDRLIMRFLSTEDGSGRSTLWVGTRGSGLLRFKDGRWTRFTEKDGLPDSWVYSIHERVLPNGQRELWIGTRNGAARMVDGRWTSFGDGKAIPRSPILAFCETTEPGKPKQFWIATRGAGLAKEVGKGWQIITTADGLCNIHVTALLETRDPSGHWLWAGTYNGLSRLRLDLPSGAWETMGQGALPPLPSNLVYQLAKDDQGRVFVFTHRGVVRLTPRKPSAQNPSLFDLYTYTTGDGLPSNGCTMSSGFVDRRGRLWTGTVAGAAMLDLSQEAFDRSPKPLLLEHVKLGSASKPLDRLLEIPWRSPRLSLEYALLSFFREEDTRYRTQLEGLEAQPSEWLADAKREYSTLPAGSYTFKVWGRDFAGNESGPVSLRIKVLPAPWLTWWAITLEVLGGLGLVAGMVWYRTRRLLKQTQELEAKVAQRTQELRLANEALRDQSLTDPLTGLRNRRYLGECMAEDVAQVQRIHRDHSCDRRERLSLNIDLLFIMLDLDHFKTVNDEHGHAAGDRVLQQVAAILGHTVRDSDTAVRWGGEEFLVVARHAARRDATVLVERIRANVEAHAFDIGEGRSIRCTCSIGFTSFPFVSRHPELFVWERVLALADQALYAAKQSGRNAWVGLYSTEDASPERLKKGLPGDIPGLVQEGQIEVLTSMPNPAALEWGTDL